MITVAHRLLKHCIPFHTLLLLPTSCSPLEVPHQPRFRHANYVFSKADFHSAMLACKAVLQGIAGRAALLRGGIIGRIAREFISEDCILDGPSDEVIYNCAGYVIDSEVVGHQYWDDALTVDEIAIICGTFTPFTGYGEQTATLSYFPPPAIWDENGFAWLEWTDAAETMFQSILLRNQQGSPPVNTAKWRNNLRGFGYTRRVLNANFDRSSDYLDNHCPIRGRR